MESHKNRIQAKSTPPVRILSCSLERKRALTVWSKVYFAIGGAPYQITGSALGFFLQIFLLDVALLDPLNAFVILFVGRAWDAVTDPTVGFLVNRTPWTRHGRMMPWILMSTTPAVLCYFLIWVVPPIEEGKMMWYLLFYCLFQTLQTCFHVPYSALTMFISIEQKERDLATAYRMTVEVLGTVIGTAVQGQIVGMANTPCINSTSPTNGSNHSMHGNNSLILRSKHAYMIASAVISLIYVLCAVVLFFGVREQDKQKHVSFQTGLRLVIGHGPYVKLVSNRCFYFRSMLPDVVDDFKVQNPTSHGHEAIFYSFYVFFTKFASGVSLGVSTLALSFAGYVTGVCVQSDSVNLTLKMLVLAAPVSLRALGLLIFKMYPINEERRQYNNKQLQLLYQLSSEKLQCHFHFVFL
uniref:Major facilitator superfamily domain containing 2aa n=1 Tax=Sinocyclocheilus anshuiensis TaxID=1608454 RepID=A0A671SGW1_9TELE